MTYGREHPVMLFLYNSFSFVLYLYFSLSLSQSNYLNLSLSVVVVYLVACCAVARGPEQSEIVPFAEEQVSLSVE